MKEGGSNSTMQNQKYNRLMSKNFLEIISNHLYSYPTPINISYLWSFGALAGICLVIQIITGIFLAMHYTPNTAYAFISVEHIMRDVNNGWFIRFLHANGASFFFLIVYCHIFRGLYYSSYTFPRTYLWCSGVIIFILMMATAFIGYVLPWGQMSFWGATVITNLFSAIPIVGESIVQWLWGGFSVDNATLNRFFSLHYLVPFIIVALVFIHLILLHGNGSTNPTGIDNKFNKIPFYPYFYIKDLFSLLIFLIIIFYFIYFNPNALGHPDNYIKANPLVTPAHIVPEWYFLPFYAILRSIPDKLGGVLAMGLSLIILLLLPVINMTNKRSVLYSPLYKISYWYFLIIFIILGWIGQKVVETPFIEIGQGATLFYFLYFLVFLPTYNSLEQYFLDQKLNLVFIKNTILEINISINAQILYFMSKFFNNSLLVITVLLILITLNLLDWNILLFNEYVYTTIYVRFILYLGSIFSLYILVKYFTNIKNKLKYLDFVIVGLSALNFALKYNNNLFVFYGLFFIIYTIFLYFNYKNIDIVKNYKKFINDNPNYLFYNYFVSLILSLSAVLFHNYDFLVGMLKGFTKKTLVLSLSVGVVVNSDEIIRSGASL